MILHARYKLSVSQLPMCTRTIRSTVHTHRPISELSEHSGSSIACADGSVSFQSAPEHADFCRDPFNVGWICTTPVLCMLKRPLVSSVNNIDFGRALVRICWTLCEVGMPNFSNTIQYNPIRYRT